MFGPLVAMGLLLRVMLTLTVRLSVVVTERVIPDRVILAVELNVLVAICVLGIGVRVRVSDIVFVTLEVKDDVSVFTDLVGYGLVGTGEGVIVMGDRVNVAEGEVVGENTPVTLMGEGDAEADKLFCGVYDIGEGLPVVVCVPKDGLGTCVNVRIEGLELGVFDCIPLIDTVMNPVVELEGKASVVTVVDERIECDALGDEETVA